MMLLWPRKGIIAAFAVAFLITILSSSSFSEASGEGKTIIDLLDVASLVVHGRVEKVIAPDRKGISIARIHLRGVIKGEVGEDTLLVGDKRLFPSDLPVYQKGRHVLLFLTGLSRYSLWNEYRSQGVQYTAVDRKDGIKELGFSSLEETAAFLQKYLELVNFGDHRSKKKYFAFLLKGLENHLGSLQEASAEALVRFPDLSLLKADEGRESLRRFVLDKGKSRIARGKLLHSFSRIEGFEEIVMESIRVDPDMRSYALASLKSMKTGGNKEKINQEIIRYCLKDASPDVRLEALNQLSSDSTPGAETLVGQAALLDSSPEVRARAIVLVGKRRGEGGIEILAQGLKDANPRVVYLAADEMRKWDSEGSAPALADLLDEEDPKKRFIGIIMLGAMKGEEALQILEEASEKHHDVKTRELSRKVLLQGPLDVDSLRQILGEDTE